MKKIHNMSKQNYKTISRIFFLLMIIFIIIYFILICKDNNKLEHMAVKYSAKSKAKDSSLNNIMKNIYIKKKGNVKIYKVGSQEDRDKLRKQNNNIYNRYMKHLISLDLTPQDVTSYVDTRLHK